MLLCHHAVPLATADGVVIGGTKQRVALESLTGIGCPLVGLGQVLFGQIAVHGYGIIHLVQV